MANDDARKSLERQPASERDNKEDSSSLGGDSSKRDRHRKSRRSRHQSSSEEDDSSSSVSGDERRRHKNSRRRRSRSSHRRSRRSSSESEESSLSDSDSESESDSDPEERRRERRRRREKEERRRKEKDRERRKRKKEKEEKRKKDKRRKEKEKKKEKEMSKTGKIGAVTNSWGKYGIIKEVDMWNKRPEFTAWLAEVKQVNLESLANWEEKQMFKEFMEDHNTATFPSKKYYDLEAFHRRQLEREMKKGIKNVPVERTIFDDEEQRRIEMQKERERQKEAEVEALKRSMQSGMAQAMKEQARLREEMMYQYRLGNNEAAAAIQRRLDPDVPM